MPNSFTATTATLLLVALSPVTESAGAQVATQIAVTGGVATDQRGVKSNAITVAPTLTFEPTPNVALQLGGNATRFSTEIWSFGAGGSFSARNPLGPYAALTLNAGANVSRLQGNPVAASFALGELVPALELRLQKLTLFGGARGAFGRSSEETVENRIPLPGGGGGTTLVSASASGAGPLFGGTLALVADADRGLQVGAREDRMQVAGEMIVDRSASLVGRASAVTLALSAGQRSARDENVSFGTAALSLAIGSGLSLDVAAGRYPRNRLLGTSGGDFASVGLSFRVGSGRDPSLPKPADVRPAPRGTTRLSIRAPDARRVDLAGDFSEWKPIAATRAANGVWYADLTVPPGQYRYAFRIDGVEWRVPDGATAVDDGLGGKSAWVTVPDRSR